MSSSKNLNEEFPDPYALVHFIKRSARQPLFSFRILWLNTLNSTSAHKLSQICNIFTPFICIIYEWISSVSTCQQVMSFHFFEITLICGQRCFFFFSASDLRQHFSPIFVKRKKNPQERRISPCAVDYFYLKEVLWANSLDQWDYIWSICSTSHILCHVSFSGDCENPRREFVALISPYRDLFFSTFTHLKKMYPAASLGRKISLSVHS